MGPGVVKEEEVDTFSEQPEEEVDTNTMTPTERILHQFRIFVAERMKYNHFSFYDTAVWGDGASLNSKVRVLKEIAASNFSKRMRNVKKRVLNEIYEQFIETHQKLQEEEQRNSNVVEWKDVSRTTKIKNIISLFQKSDILQDKRMIEREYVLDSVEEVENIFLTITVEGKKYVFPRHLLVQILSFMKYDRQLLFRLGKVCKDFYLVILSSWKRIRISPNNLFNISLLVMKNVKELIFAKKSISLSKKEMEYIWNHITFDNIRVFDLGNCNDSSKKFTDSISSFKKRIFVKKKKRSGDDRQDEEYNVFNNTKFNRCHTLILPKRFHHVNQTVSKFSISCFPNITCLHINSDQILGICDFQEESKVEVDITLKNLREIHLTIPTSLKNVSVSNIGKICVFPEQVTKLFLYMKEMGVHATKDDNIINDFFSELMKLFSQVEEYELKVECERIRIGTRRFQVFGSDEETTIPSKLKKLSLECVSVLENAIEFLLPNGVRNPCCESISIIPLVRSSSKGAVESFKNSVLSWDPIPKHFTICIGVFRHDTVEVYTSFVRTLIDLLSYDKNRLKNDNNNIHAIRGEGNEGKRTTETFRVFVWAGSASSKYKVIAEMMYNRKSQTLVIGGCMPGKITKISIRKCNLIKWIVFKNQVGENFTKNSRNIVPFEHFELVQGNLQLMYQRIKDYKR